MIKPPTHAIRIVRHDIPDAESLSEAAARRDWQDKAIALKHDERTSVLRGTIPFDDGSGRIADREIVIKSMRVDRAKDQLSARIARTRLNRQWHGADLLREASLPTARLFALWRGRNDDGSIIESLAMQWITGRTLLDHIAQDDLPPHQQHTTARRIGSDIALMSKHHLFNRDHKPSNIILHESNGSLSPIYIDTVGFRRSRADRTTDMLAKQYIEALGVGHAPRLAVCARVVRATFAASDDTHRPTSSQWKARWTVTRQAVQCHGDPTPKHNPLSV